MIRFITKNTKIMVRFVTKNTGIMVRFVTKYKKISVRVQIKQQTFFSFNVLFLSSHLKIKNKHP